MTYITAEFIFDAAHRLYFVKGRCNSLHGHTYKVQITVRRKQGNTVRGMVVDFSVLKNVAGKWIYNHLDHTVLVNKEDGSLIEYCQEEQGVEHQRKPYVFGDDPTAEVIAKEIAFEVDDLLNRWIASRFSEREIVKVVQVTVWETPTNSATYLMEK